MDITDRLNRCTGTGYKSAGLNYKDANQKDELLKLLKIYNEEYKDNNVFTRGFFSQSYNIYGAISTVEPVFATGFGAIKSMEMSLTDLSSYSPIRESPFYHKNSGAYQTRSQIINFKGEYTDGPALADSYYAKSLDVLDYVNVKITYDASPIAEEVGVDTLYASIYYINSNSKIARGNTSITLSASSRILSVPNCKGILAIYICHYSGTEIPQRFYNCITEIEVNNNFLPHFVAAKGIMGNEPTEFEVADLSSVKKFTAKSPTVNSIVLDGDYSSYFKGCKDLELNIYKSDGTTNSLLCSRISSLESFFEDCSLSDSSNIKTPLLPNSSMNYCLNYKNMFKNSTVDPSKILQYGSALYGSFDGIYDGWSGNISQLGKKAFYIPLQGNIDFSQFTVETKDDYDNVVWLVYNCKSWFLKDFDVYNLDYLSNNPKLILNKESYNNLYKLWEENPSWDSDRIKEAIDKYVISK